MPVSKLLVRHTGHNRILGIELELACNRGSCGGISMKRDLRHSKFEKTPLINLSFKRISVCYRTEEYGLLSN